NCVTSSRTPQPLGPLASVLVVGVSVSDITRTIRAFETPPKIWSVLQSCSYGPTVPDSHAPTRRHSEHDRLLPGHCARLAATRSARSSCHHESTSAADA